MKNSKSHIFKKYQKVTIEKTIAHQHPRLTLNKKQLLIYYISKILKGVGLLHKLHQAQNVSQSAFKNDHLKMHILSAQKIVLFGKKLLIVVSHITRAISITMDNWVLLRTNTSTCLKIFIPYNGAEIVYSLTLLA